MRHISTRRRPAVMAVAMTVLAAVLTACSSSTSPASSTSSAAPAAISHPAAAASTPTPTSSKATGMMGAVERSAPKPASSTHPVEQSSVISSGQIVNGEPVAPRPVNSGFHTYVDMAPPPPGGTTASFQFTAGYNVPPTTTEKIESGCPQGWYVRPGQPDVDSRTDPTASYSYSDPNEWIDHEPGDDGVSGTVTPNPNNGTIFTVLDVSFYNTSLKSHHSASITFWCDAVPSWYSTPLSAPKTATRSPQSSTHSSTTPGAGKVGTITPNCYYCSMNQQLINYSTGLALDPSTASDGGSVTVNTSDNSSDQNFYMQGSSGGSVFKDGLATFGLWQSSTVLTTAVGVNGQSPTWASASNLPPAGGQFYFVDRGAGGINGTAQLISTSTNLCLASPTSPGAQALMKTCDTTDPTQWWYTKPAV